MERTLRVEYYERTDYAVAKFWWERVSTPEPDHFPDWKGEYWSNRHLEGSLTVVRNDRHIDFNWVPGRRTGGFRMTISRRGGRDATTSRVACIASTHAPMTGCGSM